MTSHQNCRRCHQPLIEREPEHFAPIPPVPDNSDPSQLPGRDGFIAAGHSDFARTMKLIRWAFGYSQRDLAGLMKVPRTYVSKLENHKATPTLASLERFATVLGLDCFSVVWLAEQIS